MSTKLEDVKQKLAEVQKQLDAVKADAEYMATVVEINKQHDDAEKATGVAAGAVEAAIDAVRAVHGWEKEIKSPISLYRDCPVALIRAIEEATGIKWAATKGLWGNRSTRFDPYAEIADKIINETIAGDPTYKKALAQQNKATEAENKIRSARYSVVRRLNMAEQTVRYWKSIVEEYEEAAERRKADKTKADAVGNIDEKIRAERRAKVQALLDGKIKVKIS